MIKAILFDFDGVMTTEKTGTQSISNYICNKTGISANDFEKEYFKFNKGLLYGEYTHRDIWPDLCRRIGQDIDFKILEQSFINTPIDNDVINFIQEQKPQYKTAMVTDNKKDRLDYIFKFHKWETLFDVISVSAEIGSGKDDNQIFEITVGKLNIKPGECVFIDNTVKNLTIPKQMGMKTVLFDDENRNFEKFKVELYRVISECK